MYMIVCVCNVTIILKHEAHCIHFVWTIDADVFGNVASARTV